MSGAVVQIRNPLGRLDICCVTAAIVALPLSARGMTGVTEPRPRLFNVPGDLKNLLCMDTPYVRRAACRSTFTERAVMLRNAGFVYVYVDAVWQRVK